MRIATLFVLAVGLLPLQLAAEASTEPYPLEYWALREVVNGVRLSPDGKRLGMLKNESRDGNPIIEVYDADDLDGKPFRINADPMEFVDYFWVNDDSFVFIARQAVRERIEGFNQGVYEFRFGFVNVKREKILQIDEPNPALEHLLPDEPNKIILSYMEGGEDGPGSRIAEAFRPRSYWKYDINTGRKQLLIRGKLSLGNIGFDQDGDPYVARGFDAAKGELVAYYRRKGESGWTEARRIDENDFNQYSVYGLDPAKDGNWIVGANMGQDKVGLYSYDPETDELEEEIYRRSDVDIIGVELHSNTWSNYEEIVGVNYGTDKVHTVFFDEVEGAMYRQLEAAIPYAHDLTIESRSRDGDAMTILNVGPRDPGTYYLYKNRRLSVVGSRAPLLEHEKLADVEYITWKARDGATIPGYLTIPKGEPPFPLIVMPHGGPFVQEVVSWDEWAQFLANNGYMVLQPQYRGSRGYGLDFYTSAFRESGQGGYMMQDDKDDGALHLVKQGLADPDRMAMFGWSYGGYAALVAASRKPQIYQCALAGAAVTDTNMQVNYYRFALRGVGQIEQLNMWDDSIAPIDEVENLNVPLLMIHGDVDQRVPPEHARRYLKEVEKHGKEIEFVWLEGADHFYNTLFYDHQLLLYQSMIDFLENDCGSMNESPMQASAEP